MSQGRKNYIDAAFMDIIIYVQTNYEQLKDADEIKEEKGLAAYSQKLGEYHFKNNQKLYEKNASRLLDYFILRAPAYLNTLIGNNNHGPGVLNIFKTVKAITKEFKACIKPAASYLDNNTAYVPYVISDRLYQKMRWLEYLLYRIKNEELPESQAIVKKAIELAVGKRLKAITARLDQYEKSKQMKKRVSVEKFAEDYSKQMIIKFSEEKAAELKERELKAEAERIEKEKIAEQQRAEAERIAEEKKAEQLAEAKRIAEEKEAEQQRAEALRIAEEKEAEQHRVEALRIAEEIKAELQRIESQRIAAEVEAEQQRIEAENAEKENAVKLQLASTETAAKEYKTEQPILDEEKTEKENSEKPKIEVEQKEPEQIREEKTRVNIDKPVPLISTVTQTQDDGFEQVKAKALDVAQRNLNDLVLGRAFTFFRVAPDIRRADELLTNINNTKKMDELITLLAKFIYNGKTQSDTLVERSWTFKKTFLRRMVIDALCPNLLVSSRCCFSPRLFASTRTIENMLRNQIKSQQRVESKPMHQAAK